MTIPTLAEVLAVGNDAATLKIIDLGNPTNPQDAATKAYVDSVTGALNLDDVLTVGNDAGSHRIVNLSDPVGAQDAATAAWVEALIPGVFTLGQVLAAGNDGLGALISDISDPASPQDAATKNYVDTLIAALLPKEGFKVNGIFNDVNLSTEQSLISGAVASATTGWKVPANKLGANGMLRFFLAGDYLNATGSGQNITMKAKFGGTTVWGNLNTPGAITRTPFIFFGIIANMGATNSQTFQGIVPVFTNSPTGASIAGTGSPMTNSVMAAGTSAADTTLDQYFDLTAQHGAANSNLSIRRMFAVAEYL